MTFYTGAYSMVRWSTDGQRIAALVSNADPSGQTARKRWCGTNDLSSYVSASVSAERSHSAARIGDNPEGVLMVANVDGIGHEKVPVP
jgi:hypothetical protein